MSRIGKLPIKLSDKIEVVLAGNNVSVKGPLGLLSFDYSKNVIIIKEGDSLELKPVGDESGAIWGTTRSIIANMVEGVTNGFKKSLEISGVGYKFEVQDSNIILNIGFSHKVEMLIPDGLSVKADEKLKNTIHITGIDKQLVGEFASKIRAKKKPEPYKGKGIKYVGEIIRRKAGKTGK